MDEMNEAATEMTACFLWMQREWHELTQTPIEGEECNDLHEPATLDIGAYAVTVHQDLQEKAAAVRGIFAAYKKVRSEHNRIYLLAGAMFERNLITAEHRMMMENVTEMRSEDTLALTDKMNVCD